MDGRAMMRQLRKRMMTAIIDKRGRLYQGTISPSGDLTFVTFSPWTGTHFVIVISSEAKWIPFQDIPIRHIHHPLIHNPRLEAQPKIRRILTPSAINTKVTVYSLPTPRRSLPPQRHAVTACLRGGVLRACPN